MVTLSWLKDGTCARSLSYLSDSSTHSQPALGDADRALTALGDRQSIFTDQEVCHVKPSAFRTA
eukprot:4422061-Amphidinium_carterae.1